MAGRWLAMNRPLSDRRVPDEVKAAALYVDVMGRRDGARQAIELERKSFENDINTPGINHRKSAPAKALRKSIRANKAARVAAVVFGLALGAVNGLGAIYYAGVAVAQSSAAAATAAWISGIFGALQIGIGAWGTKRTTKTIRTLETMTPAQAHVARNRTIDPRQAQEVEQTARHVAEGLDRTAHYSPIPGVALAWSDIAGGRDRLDEEGLNKLADRILSEYKLGVYDTPPELGSRLTPVTRNTLE